MICPVSSAIGINSLGGTNEPSSLCHRNNELRKESRPTMSVKVTSFGKFPVLTLKIRHYRTGPTTQDSHHCTFNSTPPPPAGFLCSSLSPDCQT